MPCSSASPWWSGSASGRSAGWRRASCRRSRRTTPRRSCPRRPSPPGPPRRARASSTRETLPALVVLQPEDGSDVTPEQLAAVAGVGRGRARPGAAGRATTGTWSDYLVGEPAVVPSEDGAGAARRVLAGRREGRRPAGRRRGRHRLVRRSALRDSLEADLGATATSAGELGLQAWVTGPAGFVADLVTAFGGIDGVLLLVALGAVLLILVLVYRSPFLPFVVILTAVFALCLAGLVVYHLAKNGTLVLNGQSQGILSILVVGASVDYALLLVARYREELAPRRAPGGGHGSGAAGVRRAHRGQRRHRHRRRALPPAVRPRLQPQPRPGRGDRHRVRAARCAHAPAGAPARRSASARGSCSGRVRPPRRDRRRRARRPRRARPGRRPGLWARLARFVGRQARPVWIVTALALCVGAAFLPTLNASGTNQVDIFLTDVDAVAGEEVLAEHFPAGAVQPAIVIVDEADVDAVTAAAEGVDGVEAVVPYTGAPAPVLRRRTHRRSSSTGACASTSRRRPRPTPRRPSRRSRTCAPPCTRSAPTRSSAVPRPRRSTRSWPASGTCG